MFAKFAVIAATGIAAVNAACTNPSQFPNNPVTAPDTATFPTIGQPFDITWDDTNQGPTVTIVLLSGCPSNCIVAETIVAGAPNTGSYSWTPACSLTADTGAEGYGIQLIDDTLCEFQYSFHFGLHPGTCGASTTTTATSTTTTTSTPTSAPTSTPSSAPTSTPTSVPNGKPTSSMSYSVSASKSASASPSQSHSAGGGSGGGSGTATSSGKGPSQSGQYVNGAVEQTVSALGGVVALFAAALLF